MLGTGLVQLGIEVLYFPEGKSPTLVCFKRPSLVPTGIFKSLEELQSLTCEDALPEMEGHEQCTYCSSGLLFLLLCLWALGQGCSFFECF